MFDTFARLLASVPTFVFPVFASYKALKTSDPALLTPWLMYWVVLACALFLESWTAFILVWVPFYSWIRLGFLLYLILPQTQGAKHLYQVHVHPFLEDNEVVIDEFICSAHDRAKAAGVKYYKKAFELTKQYLFGIAPKEPTPPSTPTKFSYAQKLLARFNLPTTVLAKATQSSSSNGAATSSTANEFYSLLASAVNVVSSRDSSSTSPARDLSNSDILIPPSVSGAERLSFISAQRESLAIVLSALEKEASLLKNDVARSAASSPGRNISYRDILSETDETSERSRGSKGSLYELSKSRSEADFEKIEAESVSDEHEHQRQQVQRATSSGNWLPWSWGTQTDTTQANTVIKIAKEIGPTEDTGKSSGIDL